MKEDTYDIIEFHTIFYMMHDEIILKEHLNYLVHWMVPKLQILTVQLVHSSKSNCFILISYLPKSVKFKENSS